MLKNIINAYIDKYLHKSENAYKQLNLRMCFILNRIVLGL